jgi:5-methylcytosine-specific restriction protein B
MKVPQTDSWSPAAPIEIAAAKYKDAGAVIQDDVRYRISGFLNAYAKLKAELGSNLPYFDRDYVLRANGGSDSGPDDIADKPLNVHPPTFLTHPHQLIVTGCPGSGKSYFVDQLLQAQPCKVFRTQFHPESSFFDFVGAYKPQPVYEAPDPATPLLQGDNSTFGRGRPLIDYRFVPGPLMQGVAYAYSHPGEHVIVLIDELNRGNAAAILGDILQLLDRDGSGFSRYAIKASQEIKSFFSDQGLTVDELRLPSNLYLWATMNSADQGVFPLDTAFRRRWSYVYKGYSEPCLYSDSTVITYGGESYQWDLFRSALNSKLIELGIHEDKLIGPYFLTEAQIADSKSVLEKLFLYIYDDVLRFRQDTFFVVKSFSLVADNWKAGMGKPLKIDLPMPISVPPLDEVAPVSPPAEHAVNTANAENVEVEAGILDSTAMDTAA